MEAALAESALVVGVFVASVFRPGGMLMPALGAILVVLGCVLGYIVGFGETLSGRRSPVDRNDRGATGER